MPIFCVKSVKIYTGQKKFTRTCSWGSWQISGMDWTNAKRFNKNNLIIYYTNYTKIPPFRYKYNVVFAIVLRYWWCPGFCFPINTLCKTPETCWIYKQALQQTNTLLDTKTKNKCICIFCQTPKVRSAGYK